VPGTPQLHRPVTIHSPDGTESDELHHHKHTVRQTTA
jgi:hypothetical protein